MPLTLTLLACSVLIGPLSDGPATTLPVAGVREEDRVLRVYDLRDFAAVLPVPREARPPLGESAWLTTERGGDGPSDHPGALPTATPVDSLVNQLCASLSIMGERIAEGVYLVSGERAGHEQFTQLIENVRSVYASTCVVEIAAIAVPGPAAPQPGAVYAPAPTDRVLRRISASVPRRVETRLESVDTTTFIADWTPVVSTDAVGFDPQTASVREGLSILITPGGEANGGIPVRIAGAMSGTTMHSISSPLVASGPEGSLSLGLPDVQKRDIAAMATVAPGKATVASVVSGFEPQESIVIVVTVK